MEPLKTRRGKGSKEYIFFAMSSFCDFLEVEERKEMCWSVSWLSTNVPSISELMERKLKIIFFSLLGSFAQSDLLFLLVQSFSLLFSFFSFPSLLFLLFSVSFPFCSLFYFLLCSVSFFSFPHSFLSFFSIFFFRTVSFSCSVSFFSFAAFFFNFA